MHAGGIQALAAAAPRVPRPLGLWLPDVCLQPLVNAELSTDPKSASQFSSLRDLLSQAPWLMALPTATVQVVLAGDNALQAPVPHASCLATPSPQASVSYARSQMQLQLHLLHAWIESQLAAPLLPDPVLMQQSLQQAEQQLPNDLTRALAAWRLSHTFLCKNSWNRSAYLVSQHKTV